MSFSPSTTLTTVREMVSEAAMRLGSYNPSSAASVKRLDMAIKAAGDDWMAECRTDRASYNLGANPGAAGIDLLVAGVETAKFHPRRIIGCNVVYNDLRYQSLGVDRNQVHGLYDNMASDQFWVNAGIRGAGGIAPPTSTGTGMRFNHAFSEALDRMFVYPDYGDEVWVDFWRPFVTFTFGTVTPNSVTINIPDEFIFGFCYYAVPLKYDLAQYDARVYGTLKREYEEYLAQCKTRASGTTVLTTDPIWDR